MPQTRKNTAEPIHIEVNKKKEKGTSSHVCCNAPPACVVGGWVHQTNHANHSMIHMRIANVFTQQFAVAERRTSSVRSTCGCGLDRRSDADYKSRALLLVNLVLTIFLRCCPDVEKPQVTDSGPQRKPKTGQIKESFVAYN